MCAPLSCEIDLYLDIFYFCFCWWGTVVWCYKDTTVPVGWHAVLGSFYRLPEVIVYGRMFQMSQYLICTMTLQHSANLCTWAANKRITLHCCKVVSAAVTSEHSIESIPSQYWCMQSLLTRKLMHKHAKRCLHAKTRIYKESKNCRYKAEHSILQCLSLQTQI